MILTARARNGCGGALERGCGAVAVSVARRLGVGQGEEAGGPRECFRERPTGELGPVFAIGAGVPRCAALRRRRGKGPLGPGDGPDTGSRLDEIAGIGKVAELAADEPQPCEGSLERPALGGVEGG